MYIGSSNDSKYDQELENVDLKNFKEGTHDLEVKCSKIDLNKIPTRNDLIGVSAMFLSFKYQD